MCNIRENLILHLTEVRRRLSGQNRVHSDILSRPHCHLYQGVGQMEGWEGEDAGEGDG